MFKLCFMIYLLIHILGDYYFQSEKLAEQKCRSLKKVLWHNLIYLMVALLVCLPVFTLDMLISVLVLSLFHAVIDLVKYRMMRKQYESGITDQRRRTAYFLDQGFHRSASSD